MAQLLETVLASRQEELLLGFTFPSLDGECVALVDDCRLADDDEVQRDAMGLHWSGDLTSRLYDEARRSGQGVMFLHAHTGTHRPPRLSPTDEHTADEILPHLGVLLPDAVHAYIVINRTHVAGRIQRQERTVEVDRIRLATSPIRTWTSGSDAAADKTVLGRDQRQAAALGEQGIRRLRGSTVGIVGLGGAGSQVAEMLAHAGVGRLTLVDADHVEEVNLSRTHGASPASIGSTKVDVASAMVRRISPETVVSTIADAFPSEASMRALRMADVVVSCVDGVRPRNELNRFALRYAIPLLDLGTTITPDPFRVDGHLSLVMPGSSCLRCAGHVSDALLAELAAANIRGEYGLGEGRPQVVSFNGLLASAAVTEVLQLICGFAVRSQGSVEWHYDPVVGELRRIGLPSNRCSECVWYGMKGDYA